MYGEGWYPSPSNIRNKEITRKCLYMYKYINYIVLVFPTRRQYICTFSEFYHSRNLYQKSYLLPNMWRKFSSIHFFIGLGYCSFRTWSYYNKWFAAIKIHLIQLSSVTNLITIILTCFIICKDYYVLISNFEEII